MGRSDIVGTKTATATKQMLAQQHTDSQRRAQWETEMLKQSRYQSDMLHRLVVLLETAQGRVEPR